MAALRDTPPGCEGIAKKSLAHAATWKSGAEKNSHTFQFMRGGIPIRDWVRKTFPRIKNTWAGEAREFIWRFHRDGLKFLNFLDEYFVEQATGLGHPSIYCLGQMLDLAYSMSRKTDHITGLNEYDAFMALAVEKYSLRWKSKNPPTLGDVKAACYRGNSGGYFQALVRWSRLTPAEMQGCAETKL